MSILLIFVIIPCIICTTVITESPTTTTATTSTISSATTSDTNTLEGSGDYTSLATTTVQIDLSSGIHFVFKWF